MDSISRPAVVWWWSRASYGVSPTTPPHRNGTHDRALGRALALAFPAGAIGLFILVASGRRAARPIKQSDRPTRTCGGRRRRRFLFRLMDRGDEELELGWSWRPPLRPDADVGFAGSAERLPPQTAPTMVAHRNCYRNWAALTISLRFPRAREGSGHHELASRASRRCRAERHARGESNSWPVDLLFRLFYFCWLLPTDCSAERHA
jgi:hypothetical protein